MKLDEIKLIVPTGKIEWLFRDKLGWIISMGYQADNTFIKILKQKIQESYFYGNYTIQDHTHYGVKIRLNVDLPGNHVKNNKIYKIVSSFTVFPNGKIKCNTLIGGWQK